MNTCLLLLCLSFGAPDPPRDRVFGEDKWKHFFTSFIVTSLAATGARAAGAGDDASLVIGAGVGTGVGAAKEIMDRRGRGGIPSVLDFAWDVAGVAAATAVGAQAK